MYLRLVGKPQDVYAMLEPMYSDYRKIRKRNVIGTQSCVFPSFPEVLVAYAGC